MTACRAAALCCAFVLLFHTASSSAQDYPSKSIRLVVPYAPGGYTDIAFRTVSPALEERLGQRFVMDHKPGASGNIGAVDVARSAPDGYTLLLGASNNFATNQYLAPDKSVDPQAAFAPIGVITNAPTIVVVNASVPVNSLRELADYAKKNPGKLNYGSPGVGSPPHLSAELFSHIAGVKMTHVPYHGAHPAVIALRQGDVHVYFSIFGNISSLLKSGAVKPLAVASHARLALLPDVPSSAEAGFPDLITGSWVALAAPKGSDAKILDRLNAELRAALNDATVSKRFAEMGMVPMGMSQDDSVSFINREAARWKKVIETAGIVGSQK